tara:strand:+ start:74 stop:1093 length:1020 start_codon:yes stop_codon:yes gene_type:complete
MIVKDFQLIEKINANLFQSFLIYGPNEGLTREIVENIYKQFSKESQCEKISILGKQIDEDNLILNNELRSISIFNPYKFIVLESIKEKHASIIEETLNENFSNVCMVIKSDNLTKSSKLRKIYESAKSHYIIACYEDDIKSISSIIEKFQRENNIKFDRDVKDYLLQNLNNDRSVIKNELEKILLKSGNDKLITIEQIKLILHDGANTSFQKINNAIMSGKTDNSSKLLEKIFNEGASPVVILKSMNNYLNRIRLAQIELRKGKSFEEAIKILKPPIFWKEKSDFSNHCSIWPSQVIENKINEILNTEIECMKNNLISKELCEFALLKIANTGRNYSKN